MNQRLMQLRQLGVRYPIMQAGMPNIADAYLAAAVSRAGGIGTIGLQDLSTWSQSLRQAQRLAGHCPINANLLLPYTRSAHVDAVLRVGIPMVTLFWGKSAPYIRQLKPHGVMVWQQVGSVVEAQAALDAGIDGLIVQGTEAGGHLRGTAPLAVLLAQVCAIRGDIPVLAAGGMYDATDMYWALQQGADGVASGTRFLLTHESAAHAACKQALLTANQTIQTTLFGLGWATPHRVVPNAATQQWCNPDGQVPWWLQRFNQSMGWTRQCLPMKVESARFQRPQWPLLTNATFSTVLSTEHQEAVALYAGQEICRIQSLCSAAEAVAELARGLE